MQGNYRQRVMMCREFMLGSRTSSSASFQAQYKNADGDVRARAPMRTHEVERWKSFPGQSFRPET